MRTNRNRATSRDRKGPGIVRSKSKPLPQDYSLRSSRLVIEYANEPNEPIDDANEDLKMTANLTLNINGKSTHIATDPDRPLLDVLREDLQLTGTKYGCGESRCGA